MPCFELIAAFVEILHAAPLSSAGGRVRARAPYPPGLDPFGGLAVSQKSLASKIPKGHSFDRALRDLLQRW